ncbi:Gfo/Idh/MocA family protein [Roseobacteraceae bacterium S113]
MKTLLIGTGMVAPIHVAALKGAGLDLVAVMGRDPGRTARFATAIDAAPMTSLDAALELGPELGIVVTPPDARAEIAAALAAARIPTLMEKPVERSLSAARDIVETFEATQTPLGIFFQHRTRAASRLLKERLASGDLGALVHVDIRVPWWREQSYYDAPGRGSYARDGGGVMITQAIHTLDLALWLCGPVAQVQAQMRTTPLHQLEAEDLAAGLFTFANGATGLLSATTAAYPGGAETLDIITTTARITLAGDHLIIDHIGGPREEHMPSEEGTGGGADPMAFTHGWHQSVIEDFVAALGTGPVPISGRAALGVHAVIDAMERAAKSSQTEQVQP